MREARHATLLLVEDNPINQEVARDLLNLAGLTVDIARNGIEALEKAAGQSHGQNTSRPAASSAKRTATKRKT